MNLPALRSTNAAARLSWRIRMIDGNGIFLRENRIVREARHYSGGELSFVYTFDLKSEQRNRSFET